MDAVKFLAEYNRMCNTYNDCVGCPMHDKPFCHPHDITTNDEQKKLVDAVEKWSCEHLIATNEMSDTISRAMAIDAIDSIGSLDTDADRGYARSVFEALPSAQPETIRCKDCKYQDENQRRVSVRWLPCMDVQTDSNWYCGSAERGR